MKKYSLDKDAFGQLLERRGFSSVQDFARRSGIHRNTLQLYLSGKKSLFSDVACRIAEQLGVEPPVLIAADWLPSYAGAEFAQLLSALKVLSEKHPQVAFILIGSRAQRNAARYSDWDVAITGGDRPLATKEYLRLVAAIDDASEDFGRTVDVVNLDAAPLHFLQDVARKKVLFLAGNREVYSYFQGVLHGIRQNKQAA